RYFRVLEDALGRAQRSILIIGWDFDGGIYLHSEAGGPNPALGELLRGLVERNSRLEIRILIWSLSIIHAPGDPYAKLFGDQWQDHPRLMLRLDRDHPFYACHHQKI